MHDDGVLHAWLIFNLHTKMSFIFTRYVTWYLQIYNNSQGRKNNPCFQSNPILLTWRTRFFAHGDKFPSTLVSGLPATAPPLGFCPFHPFLTRQFTLHGLHRRPHQSRSSSSGTWLTICCVRISYGKRPTNPWVGGVLLGIHYPDIS
jgi:hypothetical protein